jgi:choline kinase
MDALIMAAGRGSRLGPHSDDRPKSLVDIGGISPLELQVDLLVARGVRRIVLVTGYRRAMVVGAAQARTNGSDATVVPVWNPFWPVSNVIGSVWMARHELSGEFVYLHADTVFEPSILDDLLASGADAALPVDFRSCEPEQMKATVRDGRVTRLSKLLPPESTSGEFIGIGLFRRGALPELIAAIERVMDEGAVNEYFEAAVNEAIDRGLDVQAVPTRGRRWTEIDFLEDLELARSIRAHLSDPPTGR